MLIRTLLICLAIFCYCFQTGCKNGPIKPEIQDNPCNYFGCESGAVVRGDTNMKSLDLQLINYTPGTLSHSDYTTPEMTNYRSSGVIYSSIINLEKESSTGLNGFILLSHIGTSPERKDKFYNYLESIISELKSKGYKFKRIDTLLSHSPS